MFCEIDKNRITLGKIKHKFGIDIHPKGDHGPPHGHFYRIKNGKRDRDIDSFYLKSGQPKDGEEVQGYDPRYLERDPLGPKAKQIIVELAKEQVGGDTKWNSMVKDLDDNYTKGLSKEEAEIIRVPSAYLKPQEILRRWPDQVDWQEGSFRGVNVSSTPKNPNDTKSGRGGGGTGVTKKGPHGKIYVKGFMKKDGTKVDTYWRDYRDEVYMTRIDKLIQDCKQFLGEIPDRL